MKTVFILAAGDMVRWDKSWETALDFDMPQYFPKHLAPFNGVPLIARTINKVYQVSPDAEVCVAIARPDTAKVLSEFYKCYRKFTLCSFGETYCTAETLYQLLLRRRRHALVHGTVVLNPSKFIVLLGDVLFTDDTLETMLLDERSWPTFYGDNKDLFGITFASNHAEIIALEALHAVKHALRKGDPNSGKIWQVYRSFCAQDLDMHVIENMHFHPVGDGTADIDTLQEYLDLAKARSCFEWKALSTKCEWHFQVHNSPCNGPTSRDDLTVY